MPERAQTLNELVEVLINILTEKAIEDLVFEVTTGGIRIGLKTASRDLNMRDIMDVDTDALRSIAFRTKAISESTMSQARGALAHNSHKLQQEVNAAVMEGMVEDEALNMIETRVKKLFEDSFPKWKLERLVRDQFLVALKEGRRTGWQRGEVKYRKWQMTRDHKTAEDSKRMHGQIQPIDQPYVDPKTGDKYMIPHIRPNDRCFEVPLWELPKNIIKRKGQMYEV